MQHISYALLSALLTVAQPLSVHADDHHNIPSAAPVRTILRGKVVDAKTGETVVGANIYLKTDRHISTTTGLDGSFALNVEGHSGTLVYTCLGYKAGEVELDAVSTDAELSLPMEEQGVALGEAVIMAHNPGRTEAGARGIERRAVNVMNVMSAKAIELSPDLTVANALGRISGVTLERGASGEGQYAILRGMDKRYNYTLVNGVKIPSPDNKNRFVPLDIFPAEMLDRLEVSKSLTADLEGDGIGGAVNLVMKDAPDRRQLTASATVGYSARYFGTDFATFGTGDLRSSSPTQLHGQTYRPTMSDFSTAALAVSRRSFVPDVTLGLSYGDRFLSDRLGVMVAASAQHLYRGKSGDIYAQAGVPLDSITHREFSEEQTRLGAHLKLDYALSPRHRLAWYNALLHFRSSQVRVTEEEKEESTRLRLNMQDIFNSTLMGEHRFLDDDALHLDWRAVYSRATNRTPDNTEIFLTTTHRPDHTIQTLNRQTAMTKRWERNTDADWAGYLDAAYRLTAGQATLDLKAGGMFRDKQRTSLYHEYFFEPAAGYEEQVRYGTEAQHGWANFDELRFDVKRGINVDDPLNYDAAEQVGAAYAMGKLTQGGWELTAGLRAEHTRQSYDLKHPKEGAQNRGEQRYWDLLPDLHLKRSLHADGYLRFSYARAINRPGFFEIVPYNLIGEDYKERGNPNLKHTVADNFDLRYEWFLSPSEQLLAGVFYKRIQNPIEYGMETSGQDTYFTPENFGTAHNAGLEIDVTKFFRRFGVKANYTYTYSRIRTDKTVEEPNPDANAETTTVTRTVKQNRPLYGQAAHVANLSLLYKDTRHGWDAQLALNYTGKRLCVVSRFLDNDSWEDGYPQLDASVEKKFGQTGWSLFAKANNLLNLPLVQYVKGNERVNKYLTQASGQPAVEQHAGGLLERKERHGQSFLVGVRFKL